QKPCREISQAAAEKTSGFHPVPFITYANNKLGCGGVPPRSRISLRARHVDVSNSRSGQLWRRGARAALVCACENPAPGRGRGVSGTYATAARKGVSCKNIRLSSDVANPLRKSQH